jgi:hypothetical protein
MLSIGAVVLEDAAFGRHPGWDDVGRVLLFAVAGSRPRLSGPAR